MSRLAAAAADAAVIAATETGDAAHLSMEAARRAEQAAMRTAEAAKLTARAARRGKQDADVALERANEAESEAGARFQEAQALDFSRNSRSRAGNGTSI